MVAGLAALFISATAAQAQTYHSGNIASNETWAAAGNPHIITGGVGVNNGITLTIEPDCVVKFNATYYIYVSGVLDADGTSAQPIVFTSNAGTPSKRGLGPYRV